MNTTKLRPIYEVIDESYIKDSKNFPDDFIKECMDNSDKAHNIPRDVKNNIKLMVMEKWLYAQVIMLRQDDLKFVATDKNKNKAKFKFQDQSTRSQWWFDLGLDWIEVNFSTRELDFFKETFSKPQRYKIY